MITDILNRIANGLFILAFLPLSIGGIIALFFVSDDALLTMIPVLIDAYQFTIIFFLFILIPLSFIRPIRAYIQHLFVLVRTVLFVCLHCLCLITIYGSWGKFEAILSSLFLIVGLTIGSIFDLIRAGAWIGLTHVLVMIAGIGLCFFIELKIYDYADKKS